jgi:hypothetical protein
MIEKISGKNLIKGKIPKYMIEGINNDLKIYFSRR